MAYIAPIANPRFTNGVSLVLYRTASFVGIGIVVCTYRGMDGVVRCVVEQKDGLSFITEEANLELLNIPHDKTKIELVPSKF